MDSEQLSRYFGNKYLIPEEEFVKLTGFKELISWDVSGIDDSTYLYIGKVDNRFFYYRESNGKVWHDDWSFLDELE